MHPNLAALDRIDFTPYPWMKAALQEYGTQRVPKHPDFNPRVVEYLRVVGLPRKGQDDDESWCSAFANWCMKQVSIKGSMSGMARSWLRWGKMLPQPVFGAVTVLSRGPNSALGHVAFFVSRQGSKLLLLGGNQTLREHRVTLKSTVILKEYPQDRLLGFRWPADPAVPANGDAPRDLLPLVPG